MSATCPNTLSGQHIYHVNPRIRSREFCKCGAWRDVGGKHSK